MKPRDKYMQHARNARRVGTPFLLTFEEWWHIWETSGHWAERGKRRGQYVMSRPGDQGAYEVGNVVIRTNTDNALEQHTHRRQTYGADHHCSGKYGADHPAFGNDSWAVMDDVAREQRRHKVSSALKGRPKSEQHRKRLSEAATRYYGRRS